MQRLTTAEQEPRHTLPRDAVVRDRRTQLQVRHLQQHRPQAEHGDELRRAVLVPLQQRRAVPNRNFTLPATDGISWHDISPRAGIAYDLFGTGKTALKGSSGKYVAGQALRGNDANVIFGDGLPAGRTKQRAHDDRQLRGRRKAARDSHGISLVERSQHHRAVSRAVLLSAVAVSDAGEVSRVVPDPEDRRRPQRRAAERPGSAGDRQLRRDQLHVQPSLRRPLAGGAPNVTVNVVSPGQCTATAGISSICGSVRFCGLAGRRRR
jgi:hypothetical protein